MIQLTLSGMEPVESKEAIAATEIKIKDEVVSDVEDDVHEEGDDDDDDEDDDDDDKTRVLTHKDAMEEFKNGLAELIIVGVEYIIGIYCCHLSFLVYVHACANAHTHEHVHTF